jgi:hypothetical protein
MTSFASGGVIVDAVDPLTGSGINAEIGSITSVDLPQNVETVADDSGAVYDEGQAITQVSPIANVTTKSLAEVMSVIGVAGQCFIDGAGAPGVLVYAKNRGDCLTDVEADDHSVYTFPNGLMRLGSLSASRGSDATLSFIVDGITDGVNAPMTITHGVTLPPTLIRGQWELALCVIAGVQIKPVDVTINFNQQETKPRPLAPLIWPERIAVQKVQPIASIRGIDPRKISASGIDVTGETAIHANTMIQLVKRLTGGSYVAAATPVHITFTLAGMVVVTNPFSSSGQADATLDIEIRGIHDGVNVPIIINIAANYDPDP